MIKPGVCCICGKPCYGFQSECFECEESKYFDSLKQKIASGEDTYTYNEEKIVCPWCGELYDELNDYGCYENELYVDGDHDLKCSECGKPFTATTNIEYAFGTERIEPDHGED